MNGKEESYEFALTIKLTKSNSWLAPAGFTAIKGREAGKWTAMCEETGTKCDGYVPMEALESLLRKITLTICDSASRNDDVCIKQTLERVFT